MSIDAKAPQINKLRDLVIDGGVNPAISNTVDGPSLLFIQPKPIECMISGLPPKGQVDALVSHFFAFIHQPCPLPIPPILHQPTFLREVGVPLQQEHFIIVY